MTTVRFPCAIGVSESKMSATLVALSSDFVSVQRGGWGERRNDDGLLSVSLV